MLFWNFYSLPKRKPIIRRAWYLFKRLSIICTYFFIDTDAMAASCVSNRQRQSSPAWLDYEPIGTFGLSSFVCWHTGEKMRASVNRHSNSLTFAHFIGLLTTSFFPNCLMKKVGHICALLMITIIVPEVIDSSSTGIQSHVFNNISGKKKKTAVKSHDLSIFPSQILNWYQLIDSSMAFLKHGSSGLVQLSSWIAIAYICFWKHISHY